MDTSPETPINRIRGNAKAEMATTVRLNIKHWREVRGLTQAALSDALTKQGRPIPTAGVAKIESGLRRVDVDDLAAIAAALDVSPAVLMDPRADARIQKGVSDLGLMREQLLSQMAEYNRLRAVVAIAAQEQWDASPTPKLRDDIVTAIEDGPIDIAVAYELNYGDHGPEDDLESAMKTLVWRDRSEPTDMEDAYLWVFMNGTTYRGSDNKPADRARLDEASDG